MSPHRMQMKQIRCDDPGQRQPGSTVEPRSIASWPKRSLSTIMGQAFGSGAAEDQMAKQLQEAPPQHVVEQVNVERPKRARLSPEETRRRMEAFDERKEQFMASVRKGKS